jgi:hypothetical protein
MKYKLCEWEDNGYHDSYFYGAYYDDESNTIETCSLGATAFAMVETPAFYSFDLPTREALEKARLVLRDQIFPRLRAAEHADVLTPEDAKPGETLVTITPHKRQMKSPKPCYKCDGNGYWQNPHNPIDKRTCFTCHGSGTVPGGEPMKDPKGKIIMETIPVGIRLTVISVKAYGSFYRNGYNRPNRDNRTVTGRDDAGSILHIPLKKLRHERDPMSDAELWERADKLSHHHNYGAIAGCRAWLSKDYAAAAAKQFAAEDAAALAAGKAA